MVKEFFGAVAVVVSLLVAGATLLAQRHDGLGFLLIGLAIAMLFVAIGWFFVYPAYVDRRTTAFVEWLVERGNVGTKEIYNAVVTTKQEADALKRHYDPLRKPVTCASKVP